MEHSEVPARKLHFCTCWNETPSGYFADAASVGSHLLSTRAAGVARILHHRQQVKLDCGAYRQRYEFEVSLNKYIALQHD